jgi:hypothetical protein
MLPLPKTEAEARALVRQLGPPERDLMASFTAPLYWAVRNDDGRIGARNGSAFFLKTRERLFGVTAAHVIEGSNSWREHCSSHGRTPLRLSGKTGTSFELDWDARQLDINTTLDIATFSIDERELATIQRVPFQGFQPSWPPLPPAQWQQVTYAGYAAVETRLISHEEVEFGFVCGSGLAHSVSDTSVSSLIERPYLEPIAGVNLPPENFDFRGISGGLMIYVTEEHMRLRLNVFAGVVIAGPNTAEEEGQAISGFEVIIARRGRFINADGTLDHSLWATVAPR